MNFNFKEIYGELIALVDESPSGNFHARIIHICNPKYYNNILGSCVLAADCPSTTYPNTDNFLCDSCSTKYPFCIQCDAN